MWFTEATIAFVKELLAHLEDIEKENAELEEKLTYYERKRNQCYIAIEKLSDELRKNMYVSIEPDEVMQKPILLDEAFRILCKKVNELKEQLKYGEQHKEHAMELWNKLTCDYYPGILDEIKD
jgi:hypothetical protein